MEELFKLIPDIYASTIAARLCFDRLCEVRIANGAPVRVNYDGNGYFLCKSGITRDKSAAYVSGKNEAEQVVMRACSHSLFTVTDTLKHGYISVAGGIRLGVCGVGVADEGRLTAVKDFSSVNIRLPHEIKGCALTLAAKLATDRVKNSVIISPPAAGKTTMLRDLCRILSDRGFNVLLCDEKYEIAAVSGGMPTLDVGCRTDVISGVDKQRVFEMGIANMSPDVIVTDELFSGDMYGVRRAVTCGISVIASVHAKNLDELRAKPDWRDILSLGLFESYVVLSGPPSRSVTVYEGVAV